MDEKTMLDSGDLLQTDSEAACQKALPAESPATQQAAGSPVEFDAAQTPQASSPDAGQLVTVADIHFRNGGKVYFFDPGELTLEAGDHVIIDTARGLEFGYCAAGNHSVLRSEIVPPLRKVVRLATANDEKTAQDNREKETHAFRVCQEKITAHKLDMQLVSAEYAFDGSKILFFFTADGRVDFRELVKDLASVFRTRIELRQIGVRDKAKMVGGLGICGRPFCCGEFLDDFQPVSIKMAKTQNLSLNPTKISGTCGRLMCCLKYEQDAYEDLLKTSPKQESFVDTPDGRGTVTDVNLLRQSVKVRMEDHPETIGCYKNCDICILRNGKAKKNDPPIPRDNAPISSKPKVVEVAPDPNLAQFPEPKFLARDPQKADFFQFDTLPQTSPAGAGHDGSEKREGAPRRNRRRRKSSGHAGKAESAGPGSKPEASSARPGKVESHSGAAGTERTIRPTSQSKPEENGAPQEAKTHTPRRRPHRRRPKKPGEGGAKTDA